MDLRGFSGILVLSGILMGFFAPQSIAAEKLDQIRTREVLLGATVNFTNKPFSFKDGSGETVGFEVDLLKAIAKKIGVKLQLVEIPWESGVTKCWDKNYKWDLFDIVAGTLTIKPEREKICGFSKPYYLTGQAILTKKTGGIKDKEEIKGKPIGAMRGSTGYECATELGKPVPFDTYCDIVDALKMSIVSASIMDRSLAIAHAKTNPSLIVLDGLLTHENYGVAFPRGDKELLKLIDQVIDEKKIALEKEWFN